MKTRGTRGTINWMAPEVCRGEKVSRFSDIWSIGCLIIEMFTGQPPWSELNDESVATIEAFQ